MSSLDECIVPSAPFSSCSSQYSQENHYSWLLLRIVEGVYRSSPSFCDPLCSQWVNSLGHFAHYIPLCQFHYSDVVAYNHIPRKTSPVWKYSVSLMLSDDQISMIKNDRDTRINV